MTMDKASRKSRGQWVAPGGLCAVLLAGALAGVATGCGKKSASNNVTPSTPATQAVNAAAAPAAQPDLDAITRQLRRWIVRNQRPPRDFEDFAATANFPIPPPPEGKKYAINSQMHVILVNR